MEKKYDTILIIVLLHQGPTYSVSSDCWRWAESGMKGFPAGSHSKESACSAGDTGSIPVGKIPWRREWITPPVFLPGESHRQKRQAGYRPWRCKELDMTEWLLLLNFFFNFKEMIRYIRHLGFPDVSVVKNPPANSGGTELHPLVGKSPWKGNGHPLQYSCF